MKHLDYTTESVKKMFKLTFRYVSFLLFLSFSFSLNALQSVKEVYNQSLEAKTPAEKNLLLNKALNLSLKIDQESLSPYNLGWFLYDVGVLYFELEEYARAMLYFEKAKLFLPRENQIDFMIKEVNNKLSVHEMLKSFYIRAIEYFAIWEYVLWICFLLLLFFTSGSIFIWQKKEVFRKATLICFLFCVIVSSLALLRHFSTPLKAIVIESSLLRMGPSLQFQPVNLKPLMQGEMLFVLEVIQEGAWLKVRTKEGTIGYVEGNQNHVI